jgi:hypothetical protein
MKEEERQTFKIFVPVLIIFGTVFIGIFSFNVLAIGQLPYYDIEQDSRGNYHKAFIDNSTGNNEIYYTNDIGGQYPQDWNPSMRITNTTTESLLLDLGIFLTTDTIFIIWEELLLDVNQTINLTYYTISRDYGSNWTEPARSYENISLKYADFDPLINEPNLPLLPEGNSSTYGLHIGVHPQK